MDSLLFLATVASGLRNTLQRKPHERPSLDNCFYHYMLHLNGTTSVIPKTKNKGGVGLELERLLGVPKSSACLDCSDGEIKAFPVTKTTSRSQLRKEFNLAIGDFMASETVAITMMNPATLTTTPFESSRLYKKIQHILFVPYFRYGDSVQWLEPIIFTKDLHIYQQIKKDYEDIQLYYHKNQLTKSNIGTFLQVRTKGAGGKAPKTHAFYFRRQFLIQLFHHFK